MTRVSRRPRRLSEGASHTAQFVNVQTFGEVPAAERLTASVYSSDFKVFLT